jgi:tetratricopeptide (TPR) repeat protein
MVSSAAAAALDLAALWDFNNPAASEQRFRAALAQASGDDALILQTQIARSFGLRRDFDGTRAVLREIEPKVAAAGFEARSRWALEMGRSFASATHPKALQTTENQELARGHYNDALAIARAGRIDELAIDAIHMLAFVDTAAIDQLKWAREALAVVETSSQPGAKRWEASIRNNIGYALHQLGRYEEALVEFQRAVALREAQGNAGRVRVARWMVAWTLRALKRNDEALAMQLQLEAENEAASTPDVYVFEELETLYRTLGNEARAAHYAQRKAALQDKKP